MSEKNLIPELRFQGFEGEWMESYLENITEKIQDGTHFSPETSVIGDFKYITSKNIKFGGMDLTNVEYIPKESHKKIYQRCDVKFNDILLTKDGASTGNVCLNELTEEFSLLSSVAFIRGNKKKTINEFLFQAFLTPNGQKEILRSVAGQAITRITLTKIKKFKFIIPKFLPEQQKIASFLTAVDQHIKLLQKKKTKLEEYKKGAMQKLFSREIRFRDENGNDFPEWEEKRLGDLYSFKSTNSFSREKLNYENGVVKNIHYGDIHTKYSTSFDITKEQVPYINPELNLNRIPDENYAQEGDLVIADASENYADIGKTIELININGQKVLAGLHTFLARRKDDSLVIGFGGHLMKNPFMRKEIYRIAQGSKVLSISSNRLSEILIKIPIEFEQQKISSFLSNLDQKIEQVGIQLEKMQIWKKGLLQKMLV